MKKLNLLLLFLVFLAFSCTKEDLRNTGQEDDRYADAVLKSAGNVFQVSDESSDDTEALLEAFALARAAGKGSIVELQEGTFEIGMIEVREFFGTLTGLGKGTSIITNLPGRSPDEVIAANKLPALITFIGGEVTVSDLTVQLSEGLEWPDDLDKSMLLFSDYAADFVPAKKYIGINLADIEVAGLRNPDNYPYGGLNGVMLAPDKIAGDDPIPRSNADVNVSNSSFSDFKRGFYVHGLLRGTLSFGVQGGNEFTGNNQGLVVNENIGVHVRIENNDFSIPLYHWNCIDLNLGETVFGWQQFEDSNADPGTYEIRNNIFNCKSMAMGVMDTWRWVHPENPTWMKLIIQKNTFHLSEGAAIIDFFCAKNAQFKQNAVYGDGSMAWFWVENFWWMPESQFNVSEGVKILDNHCIDMTVDFWFWYANNCLLMGDLSNFIVNDFGENNKIIGKPNYGHSNEKFMEKAEARKERLLKMQMH